MTTSLLHSHGRTAALLVASIVVALPALAIPTAFSGTRHNISPGGAPGGRCNAALTISFAPGAFEASGTSNLGSFSYVASHCIAGFPPGPYTDGQFVWDFGDGTLIGTFTGLLTNTATPGSFDTNESIVVTGGSGRFVGAIGTGVATGMLSFGTFNGVPASTGGVSLSGNLNLAAVPEPGSWALLMAGIVGPGATTLRRRATLPLAARRDGSMPVRGEVRDSVSAHD